LTDRFENPAERLLRIINAGRKIKAQENCRKTWCSLLNVDEKDEALLLGRLGKTMALVREIAEELKALEGVNARSYLGWVPSVNSAFSRQNLNDTWQGFIKHIDDHTCNYLSNTADILAAHIPRKAWNIDTLRGISRSVNEVVEEISESELPQNVKIYMTSKLREIQIAIDEYEITGSGPIIEKVEAAFGHVVLDPEFRAAAKSYPAAEKFWAVIGKLAVLATLTLTTLQIPNEVRDYLPPAAHIDQEKPTDPSDENSG
tara:strand:+ start:1456 stop:2232 length:777 start_codon:yes stop_codon:yes gene_type:complete